MLLNDYDICVLQKSYSGENTASVIARSCAATALSLLVPVLVVSFKEKVQEILSIQTARLPGRPEADESQALQVHMGLALGMFISRLCEEKVRYIIFLIIHYIPTMNTDFWGFVKKEEWVSGIRGNFLKLECANSGSALHRS